MLAHDPLVAAARERLLSHPIYNAVDSREALRRFMEDHVYAVWDFMSIVKRLQQDLTGVTLPWKPASDPVSARFINEIVLSEESDLGPDGEPISHLEMYLKAMEEIGADTAPFLRFLNGLESCSVEDHDLPHHIRAFVSRTLNLAEHGSTLEVAADFLMGREDVIPEMFSRLLVLWDKPETEARWFKFYLERHIELDGQQHGPLANRLLERLAGCDEARREHAAHVAQEALEARHALWDGSLCRIKDYEPALV